MADPSPEVDEAWHNLGVLCMIAFRIANARRISIDGLKIMEF